MPFRHKNIRLDHWNYLGQRWFFLTLCCANRRKHFASSKFCDDFLDILRSNAATHEFAIHAYCLMPDHVHLLAEGLQPQSDLIQFMRAIKLKTSTPFERKTGKALWQKKFYDHILRNSDSPDAGAWYIWMNPVRANLCRHPEEYPFLGSLTGKWPQTSQPPVEWLPPWRKPKIAPESPGPLHKR
jgi:REP element-mobilizing transposase RayT